MFKAGDVSLGALPASAVQSSSIPWLGVVQGFSEQGQEMGWVCMDVVVGSEFGNPCTERFWGPARPQVQGLNLTPHTHHSTGAWESMENIPL